MDGSRKRPLNEEEIHELIFLPDGDISDVDLDSDPDDPRQEPRYADLAPLEVMTDIHDEHPQEEAGSQTTNSLADSLLRASRCNEARMKSKETKIYKCVEKDGPECTGHSMKRQTPPTTQRCVQFI